MKEASHLKYALCFPGQGAQRAGMGMALHDAYATSRDVFAEADDALSMHLTRLIFEGPEEELTLTANAQPAIMTVSIAALRALEGEVGAPHAPAFGAGHSLGEYTALVAAGALPFREAVSLVRKRGQWMQEAVPEGEGAMAAILGLDADTVRSVCAEAAPDGSCQAANFNSPGQIVVSGLAEAVDRAIAAAKAKGAKRAVRLNVSAPFHSRSMAPAAEKLKTEFERCTWADPRYPIVANVSATPVETVAQIRTALYEQTTSPVLWEGSVVYMADEGVGAFLELGPGDVLSGLIKRCRKGLTQMSADAPEAIEAMATFLSEGA